MIELRKNRWLRLRRTVAFTLCIAVALTGFYFYIEYRLKKVVRDFAMSAAKTTIINAANTAADSLLAELDITYDSLVNISRSDTGEVNSVEIDTMAANNFKAKLTNAIAKELASHEEVTFSLPLTAAFGYYNTALNFPRLSYTVGLTTTVGTNFSGAFEGAGINQVLHQIILNVNLESGLAMPDYDTELHTATSFLIAETVITGVVPDAFTSVIGASDETIEDIFDHGAAVN